MHVSFLNYLYLFFLPLLVFTHIQWPRCDQVRSLFCLIRLDLSVSLLDMTRIYTPSCSRARTRTRAVSPWSDREAETLKTLDLQPFPVTDIAGDAEWEMRFITSFGVIMFNSWQLCFPHLHLEAASRQTDFYENGFAVDNKIKSWGYSSSRY